MNDRMVINGTLTYSKEIGWLYLMPYDKFYVRSFRGNDIHCEWNGLVTVMKYRDYIENTLAMELLV